MLAGGVVLAVVAPVVSGVLAGSGGVPTASLVMAFLAAAIGLAAVQRMVSHPGAASVAYALPILAATYGGVAAVGSLVPGPVAMDPLWVSFAVVVVWCGGLFVLNKRHGQRTYAVVPMERSLDFQEISGVRWSMLDSPDLARHHVDGVVADLHGDLAPEWRAFLAEAALSGMPVYHVTDVQEAVAGRTQIERLSENVIGAAVPNGFYAHAKVVIDSVAALIALVVLAPVLLAVAVVIRLDSPGPALFTQKRTGFRGKVFTIYKFRTMYQAGTQGRSFTAEDDPRITRVGPFLRRTRLDELPQIFNILRGEMSWIGPRPMAIDLTEWYQREIPFFEYRHVVRPGITGWAQVQQGYADEIEGATKKLYYDFYYIKNFSFWLDLVVGVKTVATLVSGDGAR